MYWPSGDQRGTEEVLFGRVGQLERSLSFLGQPDLGIECVFFPVGTANGVGHVTA